MGLWNFMKKMVQGRPVFEIPATKDESLHLYNDPNAKYKKNLPAELPGKRTVAVARRYDETGQKVLPRAEIIHCKCWRKDHTTMQVWGTVYNHSAVNIYLDKVTLCGAEAEFDYPLAPGQQRDFMIYEGAKPKTSHDCYSEVYYRDKGNGDNFVLKHMVKFHDDEDGTFSPLEFKPLMPRGGQHSLI